MQDMVIGLDKQGKISFINPAVKATLGFSSSEIEKKSVRSIFLKSDSYKNFKKTLLTQHELKNLEVIFKTKDKQKLPTSINASTLKTKPGEKVGYIIVARDLTKQYQLIKSLQDKTAELETKMTELEEINNLMVGRELKMVEMKKKISDLENQLNE